MAGAADSGRFVFTTFGSGIDTLLAVYSPTGVPGTSLASNDDDDFRCFFDLRFSSLTFDAVAGTEYHIAVDWDLIVSVETLFFGGDVVLASLAEYQTSAGYRGLPR